MRYLALCCDYDGTIAHHGRVDEPTLAALEASARVGPQARARHRPRARRPADGLSRASICSTASSPRTARCSTGPRPARSGCWPKRRRTTFVDSAARARRRAALGRPRASSRPGSRTRTTVLETIRDLRARAAGHLQQGRGDGAARGRQQGDRACARRCDELGLSPHNVVGVGDAENDHAFLSICECSVAVANALPAVKERADIVTRGDHGAGVAELIDELLADDLASREAARCARHHIALGKRRARHARSACRRYGVSTLVVGTSGGGKSTVATGLARAAARERSYSSASSIRRATTTASKSPSCSAARSTRRAVDECVQLLGKPDQNVVVNLLGLKLDDRPAFFLALFCARPRAARAHRAAALADRRRGAPPAAGELAAGRSASAGATRRRRAWSACIAEPGRTVGAARASIRSSCSATSRARCCASSPTANRQHGAGRCAGARSSRARRCCGTSAAEHAPLRARGAEPDRAPPASAQVRRGRAAAGPQLLFPRARGKAQPARAEPDPVPAISPTASTTTRGSFIGARARSRSGCGRESRTRSWPHGSRRSSAISSWMRRLRGGRCGS